VAEKCCGECQTPRPSFTDRLSSRYANPDELNIAPTAKNWIDTVRLVTFATSFVHHSPTHLLQVNDYYVYVYIDPRSFEEFYYGKGRGHRKTAHLKDDGDNTKSRQIKEIAAAGGRPIIKVIAAGLSAEQAFLVEKTLIWRLGRNLTNKSSGHFAENFRPHQTFDRELPGFDFANDVYYVNVGEGKHRSWEDCRKYGFLSAGQGVKWRDQICRLVKGDVVAAYLAKAGFVGIGIVEDPAVPVERFKFKGRPLRNFRLVQPLIYENAHDPERSEYVVSVRWVKSVARARAHFKRKSGLFTTQLIRASLSRQPRTLKFLENAFEVEIRSLLAAE
jgi:hypothetical protein